MVLQKIIFQIFLDNLRYTFRINYLFLNVIYMVLWRDPLYHNLGLSILLSLTFLYPSFRHHQNSG